MISEILTHAKQEYPKECCGVVIVFKGREKYIPCRNIAFRQSQEFAIDPEDYANAEDMGEVVKVVHSHPTSAPHPSQNDLVAIESSSVPWIIVNPLTEQWTETKPCGYKAPLIGREYGYGVLDCYTLVRDYYAELGVYLGDYDRKGTLESDADSYLHNFTNEGFVKISIPEKHSVILMCLGYDRPNHAAIYIGDNMILHHASRRLSSRDVYGGYWAKNTYGFYSLLDLKTKV